MKQLDRLYDMTPMYYRLIINFRGIVKQLDNDGDNKICFFYVCNLYSSYEQLRFKGHLLLKNLNAEDIIQQFAIQSFSLFKDSFSLHDKHRMQLLSKEQYTYIEFLKELETNKDLFEKFDKWLDNMKKNNVKELEFFKSRASWFTELLTLEMNHINKKWHLSEPDFHALSKSLRKYLEKDFVNDKFYTEKKDDDIYNKKFLSKQYCSYYKRIKKFNGQRTKLIKK